MSDWLHALDIWLYQILSQTWLLYAPILAVVLTLTLIERWRPIEPVQPWSTARFNIVWHAAVLVLFLALSWTAWGELIVWLASSGPMLASRLPASEGVADAMARTALALVVYDFFSYWAHRLQHALPVFWAIHQFHHEEQRLSSASSLRAHWLNMPFSQMMILVPMMWLLGLDAMPHAAFLSISIFAALSHANLNLGFGPLERFLVSPRYHRLHHARAPHLHNHNFATLLPLWDHIFGTYLAPDAAHPVQTGVEGVEPVTTYWRAFIQPFILWRKMFRPRAT